MNFFKHFHKTPFWTQLVFGLVAIFALPGIQHVANNENEVTTISQLSEHTSQLPLELKAQSIFIADLQQAGTDDAEQAVIFPEFFAKSYQFDGDFNHPIRAGPAVSL